MGEGCSFLKFPGRERKMRARPCASLGLRGFLPWGKASGAVFSELLGLSGD